MIDDIIEDGLSFLMKFCNLVERLLYLWAVT